MKKFISIMLLLCATMMFSSFSYEGDDEGWEECGKDGDGSNNRGEYDCSINFSSEEVELIMGEGVDSYVRQENKKKNCKNMSRDQCLENSVGCCCAIHSSSRDYSDIRSAESYYCENTGNRKDYCSQLLVSVMNWMIGCGENAMNNWAE